MKNSQEGDILSCTQGIVVQGCNAQGVMGSGLAKHIRDQYPEVYDTYHQAHRASPLKVGEVVWCPPTQTRPFWIANAITQEFFGRTGKCYVDYDGLRACFNKIASKAKELDLPVHYPLIGAGLGGGNWTIISEIIEEELKDVPRTFWTQPSAPKPSVRQP